MSLHCLLVPPMGLDGAAVAYAVAWSVAAALTIVAVTRPGGFSLRWADARLSLTAAALIAVALGFGSVGGPLAAAVSLGAIVVWVFLTRSALRELVTSLWAR